MKDSEFIQLLNLYLDHEISAADAARLEAEVQNNPARRKVYQQYCRMQKACKVLAADFVPETAGAASADDRKIMAFDSAADRADSRGRRMGNFYTVGTFAAAAACVAIIFVGRSRQVAAEEASLLAAQQQTQTTAPVVLAPPAAPTATAALTAPASNGVNVLLVAAPPSAGPRQLGAQTRAIKATLVADPLLLTGRAQADAMMAAAMQQAEANFEWMRNVQLSPIQQPVAVTELRFETKPATLRTDDRQNVTRAPANADVEWAAFQFVK